jgi:hypothetical protein
MSLMLLLRLWSFSLKKKGLVISFGNLRTKNLGFYVMSLRAESSSSKPMLVFGLLNFYYRHSLLFFDTCHTTAESTTIKNNDWIQVLRSKYFDKPDNVGPWILKFLRYPSLLEFSKRTCLTTKQYTTLYFDTGASCMSLRSRKAQQKMSMFVLGLPKSYIFTLWSLFLKKKTAAQLCKSCNCSTAYLCFDNVIYCSSC